MKFSRVLLCIALLFVTFGSTVFSQTIVGNQQVIQVPVTAWNTPANALLSLPDDYNAGSQSYPLIVFLHGWGEAGTDINKLITTALPQRIAQGFKPAAVNPVDGKLYKFIVVSPQAPDFSFQYGHIKNIMADILKKYRVDQSRIYITGLSAGGYGTWTCMSDDIEFAKTISAIAPISSMAVDGNRPNTINNATKNGVAVWNICGMADDKWTIAVDYTNRLNAVNPVIKAKLTGLPGVGHSAWNEGYDPTWKVDNMNLYEWMLQYTRNGKSVAVNNLADPVAVAPVINAGTDQTITLPVNSIVLQGSGTAAPGLYLATAKWTRIAGPAQFTLTNETGANPTLSNLVAGVYTMELAVADSKGTIGKDTVQVTVKAPVVVNTNKAPVANAGKDITITLPANSITLSADGSYDPEGQALNGKWSKISGPAQYTLTNEHSGEPTFSNLVAGVYQVELYIYDEKGASGRDTVQVTVNGGVVNTNTNKAPVANAGKDITITLPTNSITLSADGSYDPEGQALNGKWSKISGPAQYTLTNEHSGNPTFSNLVAGVYQIELYIYDEKGASGRDTVQVTVNGGVVNTNKAPIANAGKDITITLPANSIKLSADGSYDPEGQALNGKWSKISGPAQHTLTNEHAGEPAFSNLVAGVYQVELYIYDEKGAQARDTVQVTVKSAVKSAVNGALHASVEVSGTNGISLQLYPNPASDVIRIKFTSAGTGNIKARIFDLQGKLVQSSDMEKTGMVFEKAVNISSLRAGQYLLRLEQENGKSLVEKFVKL